MGQRKILVKMTPSIARCVAGVCLGVAVNSSGGEISFEEGEAERLRTLSTELIEAKPTVGPAALEVFALDLIKRLDGVGT